MSQTITEIDICRKRGDTFPFTFTVKDSSGTAIDITGFTYKLAVDPSEEPTSNANNIFELTGTVTDGPNGKVQFSLTTGQADNLGDYFYDLEQTDTGSFIRTIAQGKFQFIQDRTK